MKTVDAGNLINCLQIMSTKNDSTVWKQCIEIVNSLPDEQKHGHWEDCSNGWMCSVCNRDSSRDTDYCPHCGAKMDEVMEEVRTYSTNTDINPELYKPAFTLINPDAEKDYLLDGRYVVRAPRRGRWIYKKNMGYFCSACIESGLSPTNADDNCGYSLDGTMKYCWNCGAKMEE